MTTWTWYAAGLMTALLLLASLVCIYALIVSGTNQSSTTPSQSQEEQKK